MAVEQRIRSSVPGPEINRFRQLLVFDRFLARIFQHFAESVILKGGDCRHVRRPKPSRWTGPSRHSGRRSWSDHEW